MTKKRGAKGYKGGGGREENKHGGVSVYTWESRKEQMET
jgi:hypothetical protein